MGVHVGQLDRVSATTRGGCSRSEPETQVWGIVLAGVHAWGNSPLEQVCSRPLLPVLGRPLVAYLVDWLMGGGVTDASICANSQTPAFRRCLGAWTQSSVALDYIEDVMPRGPAGCMRDAALRSEASTFVVLDGTLIPRFDLGALLQTHQASGAAVTMAVAGGGSLHHRTSAGAVPAQSPGSADEALEPLGVYVVSRKAMAYVPTSGYQDIKEVWIPRLHKAGEKVVTYRLDRSAAWRVSDEVSYARANRWMLQDELLADVEGGEYLRVGAALVHKTARVSPSAKLVGQVLIGPGCRIAEGVTIAGPASLGSDCQVERGAIVASSVLWSGCVIGQGAFVLQSILVDGAQIERELVVRDTTWIEPDRQLARRGIRYWGVDLALQSNPVSVPATVG